MGTWVEGWEEMSRRGGTVVPAGERATVGSTAVGIKGLGVREEVVTVVVVVVTMGRRRSVEVDGTGSDDEGGL